MGLFDFLKRKPKQEAENNTEQVTEITPKRQEMIPSAYLGIGWTQSGQGSIISVWDGTSGLGEAGPAKDYIVDYYTLRTRSKQLFKESDILYTVIKKYTKWVVGKKIELQCNPQLDVLKSEKIAFDSETFNKQFEALWHNKAETTGFDYASRQNLHMLSREAMEESKLGGDMLVVLRVKGMDVTVQHIDGKYLITPPTFPIYQADNKILANNTFDYVNPDNGNRVRMGVEIDKTGKTIAFYVRLGMPMTWERIEAYGSRSGMLMAYMVYANKEDILSTRGTPMLEVVMQKSKQLSRYTTSALAGAEARQDVAMFFEHDKESIEDDPLAGRRAIATVAQPSTPFAGAQADLPIDAEGNQLASKVAVSTKRDTFNLPKGVSIKAIDSRQEVDVPGFGNFYIDAICAAVCIPPNVATSKYNDSFSASRMAGEDWQHTFLVEREVFTFQYLRPIKNLQMYVWVLAGKIQAPGFLKAIETGNTAVITAYQRCEWVGDMFPDIDPLKTVKAIRLALGEDSANMPLMTFQNAARMAGQGDYGSILKQYAQEFDEGQSLGS